MNVSEIMSLRDKYSELKGSRVLITGISPSWGLDIAIAFAEYNCNLVLQIPDPSPETDTILQMISEITPNISAYHDPITDSEKSIRFAQKAIQIYGGIETVINLIPINLYHIETSVTLDGIESLLYAPIQVACHITQVAANRMGLTWSNGSILNVLRLPKPNTKTESTLVGIARSALTSMTKAEAYDWSEHGIRINAVAPQNNYIERSSIMGDCLHTEPDLAKIATYLASHKGKNLSGYVLSYKDRESIQ